MNRFLKRTIAIVAVIAVLFFVFSKVKLLPDVKSIFTSKPVLIEETPILVSEIHALAKLMTITYSDEIVVDTARAAVGISALIPVPGGAMISPSMEKLVIIGRGKVIAGTNLKFIKAADIIQTEDSITLYIPKAAVLEVIVNPSDFEIFIEKGRWQEAVITRQKMRVKEQLENRALQANLLEKADTRSALLLENFLKNLGYKYVRVEIRTN